MLKATAFLLLLLFLTVSSYMADSYRLLDEILFPFPSAVTPESANPVETPILPLSPPLSPPPKDASEIPGNTVPTSSAHSYGPLTFFMHDILGESSASSRVVAGILSNSGTNGQIPFAKPVNNGIINSNNPYLVRFEGLSSSNQTPNLATFSDKTEASIENILFGSIIVIDDTLTNGNESRSSVIGQAQGFYVASSDEGTGQLMAFTATFERDNFKDSLDFFGIHRTGNSESHLAVIGGTGKYVNTKGYATVKTSIPATGSTQNETKGAETLLEFNVYLA